MRLSDLIPNLQLSIEAYALGIYSGSASLLDNPIKSFRSKKNEAFIIASSSPEIEETIFNGATDKSKELYAELKDLDFYFIVYKVNGEIENLIFSEDIFLSLDEAVKYAKDNLLKM